MKHSVKSSGAASDGPAFYSSTGHDGGLDSFISHPTTAGPWSARAQHGGPPAALLARAIERLVAPAPSVLGRISVDILGPVPVGPVSVGARVLRPGRTVRLCEATMYDDDAGGRPVAVARGWCFPAADDGPRPGHARLSHGPEDGRTEEPPPGWHRGYLDSMEWRWIEGAVTRPGPALVWMRQRLPLVEGEEPTGLQRLLACVDSASGASAELDPAGWAFLNTELTVHLLRPPAGEWFCLEAVTTLGPGAIGLATSIVHDRHGPLARSAQALLVVRR